jgi:hypothetical protein
MKMQAEQVEAQLSAQQRSEEAELLARNQSDGDKKNSKAQAAVPGAPTKRTTR